MGMFCPGDHTKSTQKQNLEKKMCCISVETQTLTALIY